MVTSSVFCRAATVAFLFALGTSSSIAQPIDPLYFPEAGPAQEWTYDEVVTDDDGTQNFACTPDPECDEAKFVLEDMDGTGAVRVGSIDYAAAIWRAGVGVVVLGDGTADYVGEHITDAPPFYMDDNYGSSAFDITANAGLVVGEHRTDLLLRDRYPDPIPEGGGGEPTYTSTTLLFPWLLPVLWEHGEAGWSASRVLELPAPASLVPEPAVPVLAYGGARAVDDGGTYIAGFSGWIYSTPINSEEGTFTNDMSAPSATRWQQVEGVWMPTLLGLSYGEAGLDEALSSSVALDVNGLGQTVGWAGTLNSNDFTGDPELLVEVTTRWEGPGDGPDVDRWSPIPVLWESDMVALERPEGAYGEARAISEGGKVAVGWTGNDDFVNAAAWREGSSGWNDNELIVLGLPAANASLEPGSTFESVGAIANTVDSSGRLIGGKARWVGNPEDEGPTQYYDAATFWELDENFDLVRGAYVQSALAEAGVPMNDARLRLTETTAVRTVIDNDGNIENIFVAGTGEGSFGSWIAALGGSSDPGPGLTTDESILDSLRVVAQGVNGFTGWLGTDRHRSRPAGRTVEEQPGCLFASGSAGVGVDGGSSASEVGKLLGIAYYLDESTSVGVTGGLDWLQGANGGGSNYRALAARLGVYADHMPDEGLRASGSASIGRLIDASFERFYVNGVGVASSKGSTVGWGGALSGELGYGIALDDATRLLPFLRGSVTAFALDGWSDTGGPFNAAIDGVSATRLVATAGVVVEHDLSATQSIFAGVDWTAINSSGSGINAVVAATPFALGAPAGWWGVGSIGAGFEWDLDESSRLTGNAQLSSNLAGFVGFSAGTSYNRSF